MFVALPKIPNLFSVADVREYATDLLRELKSALPDLQRNDERFADVATEKATWDEELMM